MEKYNIYEDDYLDKLLSNSKEASIELCNLSTEIKNKAINKIADELIINAEKIVEMNKIDLENNIVLIKGNVPGPKKSLVVIKTAVKNQNKVNEIEELNTYVVETVVEETPVVEEVATEETVEATEEN